MVFTIFFDLFDSLWLPCGPIRGCCERVSVAHMTGDVMISIIIMMIDIIIIDIIIISIITIILSSSIIDIAFIGALGCLWGAFWMPFAFSWVPLGRSWAPLGTFWSMLGRS